MSIDRSVEKVRRREEIFAQKKKKVLDIREKRCIIVTVDCERLARDDMHH